jgi:hypothetical protein
MLACIQGAECAGGYAPRLAVISNRTRQANCAQGFPSGCAASLVGAGELTALAGGTVLRLTMSN